MSFNICNISGLPAMFPVISKKTGHVFEKHLIELHLRNQGKCPVTNSEMSLDDLIEIKISNQDSSLNKPRDSSSGSIPGMLNNLNSEWESLLMETCLLRKQYDDTRKELAHSLYQNDASTRVIANLLKERDSAREELLKFQNEFGRFEDVAEILDDEYNLMGIQEYLIKEITEMSYKLSANRKQRKIPLISHDFSKFKKTISFYPFEKKNSSLECFDVKQNQQLVIGSLDGKVAFLNSFLKNENIISLKPHERKINEIQFYNSEDILAFATVSDDSTGTFFIQSAANGKFEEKYRIKNIHTDSLTGISFHPINEYALISSMDSNWSFHNMHRVKIIFI